MTRVLPLLSALRRPGTLGRVGVVLLLAAGLAAATQVGTERTEQLVTADEQARPELSTPPDPSPLALRPLTPPSTARPAAPPSPTASPVPSAAPSAAPGPGRTPLPTTAASGPPAPVPGPTATPAPEPGYAGLPRVVVAASGSRVGAFRVPDGTLVGWLTPAEPGRTAGDVALATTVVLYGLQEGSAGTRDVRLAVHPAREDAGVARLGDPGTSSPAVLPDASRYAFLASGDDPAHSPRNPQDRRLVVHEMDGAALGVPLDPAWATGGLAFASPDRLVLSAARPQDDGRHGLFVADLQTDEAGLGTRQPDTAFLPAPSGCAWTRPTALPQPDRVLVVERCGRLQTAVVVHVSRGERIEDLGVLGTEGDGEVLSLDVDRTGQHLLAQVAAADEAGPALTTRRLAGDRTLTTTGRLVAPAWH